MSTPPLPAGFVLDKAPPLPAGFVLDKAAQEPARRSTGQELARQVGLTARAGIQGVGGLVGVFSDPIAAVMNQALPEGSPKAVTARALATQLADTLGLPSPENALERIIGSSAESVAGAGGSVAAARAVGGAAASPITQEVARQMAAQPAQQLAGAAGAGIGGQGAQEAGAGPLGQAAAALAGGVVGASGAGRLAAPSTAQPAPQVIADAERAGIPLMTSDVIQPKTFAGRFLQATGERIPLAGTGGMRAAQQEARQNAVRQLAADYGADVSTKFDAQVAKDLLTRRADQLTKYTQLKNQAKAAAGTAPVPVNRAVQQIDKELADISAMGPAAERGGVIQLLQDFRQSIQNQPIETLDDVRRLLGEQITKPELGLSRDLAAKIPSRVYAALRQDMTDHIQQQAGTRAARQWKIGNGSLAGLMGELDNKRLKLALNTGDETPETIRALLFSNRPSDVKTLYANLSPAGRSNARAAIIQKALQDAAKDGLEDVSPKVFSNNLRKLSDQIGVFFTKDQAEQVEGLRRAIIATQRAGDFAAAPPTGVQAVPFIGGAFLADFLGGAGAATAAGASVGLAARAMESKPVRSLLIRLASTKQNSKEEAAILKRLMATSQATQDDQQ